MKARSQIDALSRQLEEQFKLRHTDAEAALEAQEIQYNAKLHGALVLLKLLYSVLLALFVVQEKLIEELTIQLARKEPLTSTGKASVLHLITREAADEEKRLLQREVERLKQLAEDKQRIIDEKVEIISSMEQIGMQLSP